MSSVREDLLKGSKPPRSQNAQGGPELDGAAQGVGQEHQRVDEMTARLREVADQRAALVQSDIKRLEELIKTLEQRTDQPVSGLEAQLTAANKQLDIKKGELVRANEAKQNTELTSSLRQENREPALQTEQSLHQGHEHQKVGETLGMTGVPTPKQGEHAPKLKH